MVTVEIPLKFRKWFEKHRELPVRVAITETSGMDTRRASAVGCGA
jgi:hypothetical protein